MVRSEKSLSEGHSLSVCLRFARAVAVGVAHHVTQRGADHQRGFFTDGDRFAHTLEFVS